MTVLHSLRLLGILTSMKYASFIVLSSICILIVVYVFILFVHVLLTLSMYP